MAPLTAVPEAGPRLLEEYLNTNRKDFKISALLDELDMKDQAERTEFQHFLRDYMTYDPYTNTGYRKQEFAELDDAHIHCYAEQFMDEAKFKKRIWPAGKTYFPPHHLENDLQTSSQRKKWNYDDHRANIIAVVAQIMITQRNEVKKKEGPKRARNSGPGSARIEQEERAEIDDEYTPSSASALKRPRKNTGCPASIPAAGLESYNPASGPATAEPVGSSYRQEQGPAVLQGNNIASPAVMHSFVTVPTTGAGQSAGPQRSGTTASPARQMPSPPPSSVDGQNELDGIHAARQLDLQGTKLGSEPEEPDKTIEARKRDVQIFTAGIRHARQYFASACMETQLSAKMIEGQEGEQLIQRQQLVRKAQVLFDSLHEFNKAMVRSKGKLLGIVEGLDLE